MKIVAGLNGPEGKSSIDELKEVVRGCWRIFEAYKKPIVTTDGRKK